jgi:cbb3-type cytochrome oxidase subunit 3
MSTIAFGVMVIAIFAYVFWPERHVEAQTEKTRLDFLEERRDVVYDNLKDLNFEFRAGKSSEEDYAAQRAALENEAAEVVAEIDTLRLAQPL